MLKKLLNLGGKSKSNGYYLELKEDENTQSETNGKEAKSTTSVKDKKSEPKSNKTVEEKQPEPKSTTSVKDKKSEPKSDKTVKEKQPEPAKAKSTEKNEKKKVEGKDKQSAETKSNKTPVAASASSWEPPFWVKIMNEKTSSNGKQEESEKTFATDYLMPSPTQSRRRPGPSLDTYRSMARQAKTPRS